MSPQNEQELGSQGSKFLKKEKKPDRQLYSVRGKRNQTEDQDATIEDINIIREVSGSPYQKVTEETMTGGHDDDVNRSYISNVSTAMSEKIKSSEEEIDIKGRVLKLGSNTQLPIISHENSESRLLFSVCLGTEESYEAVHIYEVRSHLRFHINHVLG